MLPRLRSILIVPVALVTLLGAVPALAGGIAYVDFERAVAASTEAQQAQKQLEANYASKLAELQKMRDQMQKDYADYEQRKLILSDDARAQAEQGLMLQQQKLQQSMMTYQQDMDAQVAAAMQKLDTKLRAVSGTIAKERGYELVIDKAIVVYSGAEVIDMTDAVIRAYNATN